MRVRPRRSVCLLGLPLGPLINPVPSIRQGIMTMPTIEIINDDGVCAVCGGSGHVCVVSADSSGGFVTELCDDHLAEVADGSGAEVKED